MEFFNELKKYEVILGSNSPRRKYLLEQSGIPFKVISKKKNESFPENLTPVEVVRHLSRNKSMLYQEELKRDKVILITADTIVVHEGKILNKPANKQEALEMLNSLSGKSHEVYTGVSIIGLNKEIDIQDKTIVVFNQLDAEEIDYYVQKFKPFDKAGSYGIQEWLGAIGVEKIEGSYNNVVGLPVSKVYSAIKELMKN